MNWNEFKNKNPRNGTKIIRWGKAYGFEAIEFYRSELKFNEPYGITHWCYVNKLPKPTK